jgi:hypothetical protein
MPGSRGPARRARRPAWASPSGCFGGFASRAHLQLEALTASSNPHGPVPQRRRGAPHGGRERAPVRRPGPARLGPREDTATIGSELSSPPANASREPCPGLAASAQPNEGERRRGRGALRGQIATRCGDTRSPPLGCGAQSPYASPAARFEGEIPAIAYEFIPPRAFNSARSAALLPRTAAVRFDFCMRGHRPN